MSKKHIMGSEPAQDPVEQMKGASFTVATDSSIKWEDRKLNQTWTKPMAVTFIAFTGVFLFPLAVIVLTCAFIPAVILVRYLYTTRRIEQEGFWHRVRLNKLDFETQKRDKASRVKVETPYYITGTDLKMIGPRLATRLSSLVRAVEGGHGIFLDVSMELGDPSEVVEGENLHRLIRMYLKSRGAGGAQSYMEFNGEIWRTRVRVIGAVREASEARSFRNSVRGAVPSKDWKAIDPDTVTSAVTRLSTLDTSPAYYMVGEELSEWLVQLASELSGEVGMHIPGQFVADIRQRPADYIIGRVLNPDTLRIGPPTGLSCEDIENGVLVCGGTRDDRWNVLGKLIKKLIEDGRRVLFISSHPDAKTLTAVHSESVALTLGRDLVLNPMEAEGVPRAAYVSQLMVALETFTESNLTAAADLELALGKAVALSGASVADVKLIPDESIETKTEPTFNGKGNKHTLLGIEAIRRLHQGSGAKAFYGTQTLPLKRLAEMPLSVTSISLGDNAMENFGWDLMLMKLGGLNEDKQLVVVLDDPQSFRYRFKRYGRRETWVERLAREIDGKFSLIISMDRPSDMGNGIRNLLDSCISFRLKHDDDIASVSSALALSVIASGMHTKARWSARESSFLRTMEDGIALIVHNATETAQPVRLDPPLPLESISEEILRARLAALRPDSIVTDDEDSPKTFIENVGGAQSDLTHKVLKLLQRYEPLTEEAVRRFIQASTSEDLDVEGVIIRLREAGMILEGHENHGGVTYRNYRLTMKGLMAIRQSDAAEGAA